MLKKEPFKITVEHYRERFTIELPESDVNISELYDRFRIIAVSMGFLQETIDDCILEMAEEINSRKKK